MPEKSGTEVAPFGAGACPSAGAATAIARIASQDQSGREIICEPPLGSKPVFECRDHRMLPQIRERRTSTVRPPSGAATTTAAARGYLCAGLKYLKSGGG